MTSLLPYVFLGIVMGVAASLAVLMLSGGGVREWMSSRLQPSPAALPQPSPTVQPHAGHEAASGEAAGEAASHAEHAAAQQDNIMTVSPERLQSILDFLLWRVVNL